MYSHTNSLKMKNTLSLLPSYLVLSLIYFLDFLQNCNILKGITIFVKKTLFKATFSLKTEIILSLFIFLWGFAS